ncbi:MAG: ferric reductase-like transmembrane domain-containing protein [Gemmatimonadetes bacterium]|nr:ferric reductase-like transmembrane domain-containing protein [Gemmatimonadota bacterium]
MKVIDISAQLGLLAAWLLTLNVLLGLLLSVRYNPLKRWPYKRVNYFTLHNWTGYVALALAAAHALLLPLSTTAGWVWKDVLWPSAVPLQPTLNTLGAVSLYLVLLVVATSYVRRRMGRRAWKAVHWATYAAAALFFIHGVFVEQHLKGDPVNLFGTEKLSLLFCFAVVAWASWARLRHALRLPARGAVKEVEAHWDAPVPVEWGEG